MAKKFGKKNTPSSNKYLIECAWEVCNQVGGIYTVIRSKAQAMVNNHSGRYCMIGPYLNKNIMAELEPLEDAADVFGIATANLRKKGYDVVYAEWLITGKPRVVLLNPNVMEEKKMSVIKYLLWKNHNISTADCHPLITQVVAFAHLVFLFIEELNQLLENDRPLIAHFHEWMAGLPILDIKKDNLPIKTIFTTHATQLGRHLAINSPLFYAHLPFFKWHDEAVKFGVAIEAAIEYGCAQSCTVMSTVSDVTANECRHLLSRAPDVILPNGLNIERFEALHEFQNLHSYYKEKIHQFVMGHFFHYSPFDLEKTLYFFTSGRYEYKNKGFDLTLEALTQLNARMIQEKSDITIVMFFITKREYNNIRPEVLQSRAMMEEIRQTCEAILKQVGTHLFSESTSRRDNQLPDLNQYVEEYWRLRYRRIVQTWRSDKLPLPITHRLADEANDDILKFVTKRNFLNKAADRVKIVYHPDFINSSSPLFGMDYGHFVRGCHLGIFPSYYEPWGYTPLECMASGVPAVTSDLSGFGDYLLKNMPDYEKGGMYVVERGKRTFEWSARQLAVHLYTFIKQNRRDRIMQRNRVESYSVAFDWSTLVSHYERAYELALAGG